MNLPRLGLFGLGSIVVLGLASAQTGGEKDTPTNLVKNPVFAKAADNPRVPEHFQLAGDAEWTRAGETFEFTHRGIALHSGKDLDADGSRSGSVAQDVVGFLAMIVEFFGKSGSLDHVSRKLYPQIEADRRELAVNGKHRRGGAAVWRTYSHEFLLPFAEIDRLRLSVAFHGGTGVGERSRFFVTEWSLVPIAAPVDRVKLDAGPGGKKVVPADLVSLGGRWYYLPETPGDKTRPERLVVTRKNADRVFYQDHRLSNPFAENMSAWLLKGYKDADGKLVAEDRFVDDSIVLQFEADTLKIRTKNLPNHPTAEFPSPPGSGDRNPSYIQEHNRTYYIPLNPVYNAKAIAMDSTNANRALPMGPIALAINGVVFFNPFDAGMKDATDLMDRCCGHPSPDNRYHYHKYPVCVKSPFNDDGDDHSPLIGFAFDGLPIYGPYEKARVMAKDDKSNPLDEFNAHYDDVRGWHYHATPGRFPYILGGYRAVADERNLRKKKL